VHASFLTWPSRLAFEAFVTVVARGAWGASHARLAWKDTKTRLFYLFFFLSECVSFHLCDEILANGSLLGNIISAFKEEIGIAKKCRKRPKAKICDMKNENSKKIHQMAFPKNMGG
jgi:hypothetical protein